MSDFTLRVKNLSVGVEQQEIVRGVDLSVEESELHVLLGANGCGKSSLLSAIMGLPPFELTTGEIYYRGRRIDNLAVNERADLGIGMTFQRPPVLDGITVSEFAERLLNNNDYLQELKRLDLEKLLYRDVNAGFSGGEIKRWEILKVFLQDPQLLLFDEPESGVDLEHIKAIGEAISRLMQSKKVIDQREVGRSALVITHTGLILNYIKADIAHMMVNGEIVYSGDPARVFNHIKEKGYVIP